jgi:GlcNAc-P-P-Und epimerase
MLEGSPQRVTGGPGTDPFVDGNQLRSREPAILVTGDAGFIGSHLTTVLLEQGAAVRGLDLVSLPGQIPAYHQTVGDILDLGDLEKAIQECDTIVHLAAEHKDSGVPRERYFAVNVEGTRNLLKCASAHNVRRFIFFSSVAVYGDVPLPSEDSLPRPGNPYGESKVQAEELVDRWSREDENRLALIIRPTVVFGPRSRSNMFRLITYVCDRKFVQIGKGENIKSVAYVENLVHATGFLMKNMRPGVEIFNYADEPQMTTGELVGLIAGAAGVPEPRLVIPYLPAYLAAKALDLLGSIANRDFPITSARLKKFNTSTRFQSEKIRSRGFTPPFSIAEGLAKTILWYRDEGRRRESAYEHERVEG